VRTKEACVICGGSLEGKNRAKEHVVPDWLQKEFGFADDRADPRLLGPRHAVAGFDVNAPAEPIVLKRERRHSYQSLLAGNICADCNNGWMSQLEVEAQRSSGN
jgi:hypothetical protein